jgi:flagellar biosynthesis regulator FlaF
MCHGAAAVRHRNRLFAHHIDRLIRMCPSRQARGMDHVATGIMQAVKQRQQFRHRFAASDIRDDNKLPIPVRQNILNIAGFVIAEIFSLMTRPKPEHLANIIRINRRIAAGLRGKAATQHAPQAA